METIKIPIEIASELVSEKIKKLKENQIKTLSKQILRTVEEHIEDFFRYLNDPENFSMILNGSKVSISGTIYCQLSVIWSSQKEQYMHDNNLVVVIDGTQYFSATIEEIDFLNTSGLQFKLKFPVASNSWEEKFISVNSLSSADLL